ncbi:hypothetical protein HHX48_15075 [Salinimonas sp. HHU 13199]|uniref:ATP-grasp domain-containing protein n=1 Tax=Salinimonas profundi TaxID=2729140 RepID=A0ABR8LRL7_9ALTE|nr:YheC/YheD family protein [Salinimonas profundi]MBD3587067.1 hypothetical protein [Salinimonas profundi]
MQTTVLLLGNSTQPEIQLVQQHLLDAGTIPLIIDTTQFGQQFQLSWSATDSAGVLHCPQGQFAFNDIDAAFWFRFSLPAVTALSPNSLKDYQSTLNTLLACQSIEWCNSVEAIRYHQQKPVQLGHATKLGLTIPPTYIGNHVEQAWAFMQSHQHVICKPVHGGQHTFRISSTDTTKTDIERTLAQSPMTFQRFIEGTNIRTYVIQDTVISAEIQSSATDFRSDSHARLLAHTLPDDVAQQSIALCHAFNMRWTAIDWRYTPNEGYVFLEANPAPCFAKFERHSGHPVSKLLARMLLRAKG